MFPTHSSTSSCLLEGQLHGSAVGHHHRASIGEDGGIRLAITMHGSHVELSGAVDVVTSPSLRVELTQMINKAEPDTELQLDLRDVSLLDSSGLSVLLGAHK